MAKIKKIQEAGRTIYPATILQGIKDAESGKALGEVMARKTGNYPELTAGFAENIVGDGSSSAEVISFRPTAGENRNTLNEGAARITKLKGNSVVLNQFAKVRDSGTTTQGLTFTKVSDSEIRVSGTVQTAFSYDNVPLTTMFNFQRDGRKYLISMLAPSGVSYGISGYAVNNTGPFIWSASDGSDWPGNIIFKAAVGQTIDYTFKKPQIIDLTQMFGAGNEPTTVEQLYSMLPVGVDINAYNEGELVDGQYGALKTTALNQWDEQWQRGQISSRTGGVVDSDNKIISKNFIPVLPNTLYFLTLPSPQDDSHGVFFYDINKQYLGYQYMATGSNKNQFTTPSNCAFIRFDSWGTTYNNDICLNLSWPEYTSLNGTYQPYKPFVRNLGWISKYFPNGMRSAGSARDEIRFNSTTQKWEAVQNVGVVDLGSLTWTTDTVGDKVGFVVRSKVVVPPADYYTKVNMLCSKYVTVIQYGNTQYANDKVIFANGNGWIQVADYAYTDAATFKAAMSGVMLNYELAEPIVTEIEENVNFDFDVSDYGTEELLVAEGAQSAPLSADIVYAPNALSTLKNVPDIFTRLAALEAALASLTSATTTNVEE